MVIIIIVIIVFLGPQESCIALHIATQSASRRSLPSQHKPATGTRKLQARPREEPKHRGGRRTAAPCVRASVRPSIALHCTSLVNGTTMDTEAVAELLRSELAAADALLEIFATQHADPTQQAHILDHIRYDAASRSCEDDACTHTDRIHPPSLGQLRTAPHLGVASAAVGVGSGPGGVPCARPPRAWRGPLRHSEQRAELTDRSTD